MFKWIKHHFNRESVKQSSQLHWLSKYLSHPDLWKFNRHSVALGTAIGLAIGIITVLPIQMILAALLAILLRANLPIAIGMTWICNPFTILPITYLNYIVGNWILNTNEKDIHVQSFQWQWNNLEALWSSFSAWMLHFGKSFFIGLPVVMIMIALIGYLAIVITWHGSQFISEHFRKKKS